MRFKDILPNTIYKYVGNANRAAFWFRTGDTVTAVKSPLSIVRTAPKNHLLVQTDHGWNHHGEVDRFVDHVEVLRWVDNEGVDRDGHLRELHHGDEALDLTFQPQPFSQYSTRLPGWYNPFTDDRTDWADGEREALVAEWGTEHYWKAESLPALASLGDHVGTVPLAGVEGPFDEAEKAAETIVKRAEAAERAARRHEVSEVREAERKQAEAFLVQTLANVPDALVDQASNGLDRAVERARTTGVSDWSLNNGWRDDINLATPDGGSLVGLTASSLAAITYAWQQTFGDASWEDIKAGVYERYHASDEVKHIAVDVPATEDVAVTAERVERFLPGNYEVVSTETYRNGSQVLVKGTDVAGWTAADYVIPRLASGLLTAEVYSLSRKAVSA